jgi:hypothetical protein
MKNQKQVHALKTKLASLEIKIADAKRANIAKGFSPSHKTSALADLQNKAEALRLMISSL